MLRARTLLPTYHPNWFASVTRALADWLDPPAAPTVADEIRAAIEETRRELLVAEGMAEEASHSVAMLRERLQRLEGTPLR